MIGLEEARHSLLAAATTRCGYERVPLLDAVGRVITRSLYASDDLVPFARSAMDGYAVASADTTDAARTFLVHEPIYAEQSTLRHQSSGMVTPIATGAPLPEGADAVVPIEDTTRVDGGVRFAGRLLSGENVFPPGDDARLGDLLVPEGTVIAPATLGLLAAAGCAFVDVARRPRVSLISTGEELVAIGEAPSRGQVRNSNAPVIASAIAANGGRVHVNACIRDDRHALRDAVEHALADCDLLITTGGASVGERDYMKSVLREAGVSFAFDEVALRPGRPFAFGSRGATYVAVLPGNPSSAFVILTEFVQPFLRVLQGCTQPWPPRVRATLRGRIHARPSRTYAPYVALRFLGNGLQAIPLTNQCSSLTRTFAEAAGLAIVPPGSTDYVWGDAVDVDIVDWSRVESAPKADDILQSCTSNDHQVGLHHFC
jgi:molybdopterin molybdotransferase